MRAGSIHRLAVTGTGHIQQLAIISKGIVKALEERQVSPDFSQQLKDLFPEGAYISTTVVASARGMTLELHEYYNLLQPGLQSQNSSFTSARSVAAEVIQGNLNRCYDAEHSSKYSDFHLLKLLFNCSQVLCVPLHCHSKLHKDGDQADSVCSHCHRKLDSTPEAVGCITVGTKKGLSFSLREYLAKLVVIGSLVGPELIASQQSASRPCLPLTSNGTPAPLSGPLPSPFGAAAAFLQTFPTSMPQSQPLSIMPAGADIPATNLLALALQSNWYASATTGSPAAVAVSTAHAMPLISRHDSLSSSHSALSNMCPSLDISAASLRPSLDFPGSLRLSLDGGCLAGLGSLRPSLDGMMAMPDRRVSMSLPTSSAVDGAKLTDQRRGGSLDTSLAGVFSGFTSAGAPPAAWPSHLVQGPAADPVPGSAGLDAMTAEKLHQTSQNIETMQLMALLSLIGNQGTANPNGMP